MRPTLPLLCLLAIVSPTFGQLPSDGKTFYARDTRIKIPFDLRADGPAASVKLFVSVEGGTWREHDTAKPGQKREFIFTAERDGAYGFATMTTYRDGTTDPSRRDQLTEQRRVIVDRMPPKIVSLRTSVSADGAPGIEWEATDENMDPKGIKLEFRWPDAVRFDPIDRGVPFSARDSRHWQLKSGERMQVRVVATDRAENKTISDPVWVSLKEGEREPARDRESRPLANGTSGVRDADVAPAGGGARVQPPLFYVKTRTFTFNSNATNVGPSGLTAAYLYAADDKLQWQMVKDLGPQEAPPANTPDKPRTIPLQFGFEAPKDGLFNLIVITKNHVRASRPAPRQGERGDVQVIVDTTLPKVEELTCKVSSNGEHGAVVDIRWKATDANIAPVPIKIEYQAVGKDAEWKPVTPDWIDNVGQHAWTAPTGEAHIFLIRVTCKDRAGNEGVLLTREPVNVDLSVPGVEYGDVRPGRSVLPERGAPGMSDIEIVPGLPPGPAKGPKK